MYKKLRILARDYVEQAIFTLYVHAIQKDSPLPSELLSTSVSSRQNLFFHDWPFILRKLPL